jgi:dipeptidyl aminopeptidase/acylaminoacyl peptidase
MSSKRLPAALCLALSAGLALCCFAAATASASSRIVFAHHGRLLAVSPSGGPLHRIGTVPRSTLDISASRSGRRIALIANRKLPYPNRGSVRTIYMWRAGRGVEVVRRFRSTAPLDIAVSPDGRRIAFGRMSEIWIMSADGTGARQVTDGRSVAWDPAFTPDGRGLVFLRDDRHTPRLHRKRLGGGGEQLLVGGEARSPAVAPNGLVTYIRSAEGRVASRLIVMRLDGGGRHTIDRFNDPVFDQNPTFSPGGRRVAFLRLWERTGFASSYRYSVHTMTSGGRGQRKLVGGLRSSAKNPPFAGHGPAGPVWTRFP